MLKTEVECNAEMKVLDEASGQKLCRDPKTNEECQRARGSKFTYSSQDGGCIQVGVQ